MAESIKKFIIKDAHGVTRESGSFSVVGEVHVNLVPGYGEPYADSEYVNGILTITIHNIEGNGITEITTDSQEGDEAVNTVTIKTNDNPEGVVLEVRNGSKGETGPQGPQGIPGEGAIWTGEGEEIMTLEQETGQAINKAMSQKAVTEMSFQRLTKWTHFNEESRGGFTFNSGVVGYGNSSHYKHIQFKLNNLKGKKIKLINNSNTDTLYALTLNQHLNGDTVLFPEGEKQKILAANSEAFLDIPDNTPLLYFYIISLYNDNAIDFDLYVVDTVKEFIEQGKESEIAKMETSLANGIPYKLDKDNLCIFPTYATNMVYNAVQASVGKKPEQVNVSCQYDAKTYLIPVDNVAYIKMYCFGGEGNYGNLFLDEEYNIVHFCGMHNEGIGYALVPSNARYLLYTEYNIMYAELTMYPKIKREFAGPRTFTLGDGDWQKMLYYRVASSQQVGDSFFADSTIEIADKSITSGGETTTIGMYLIDISGYDYIDMLSFRNSSGVGHDILDENGIVLKHISRLPAWGDGYDVPTVDIPAGGKWLVYHCYANKLDIQRGVTLRTKGAVKKTVRILYIGNSLTQDGVAYLPKLLDELAPEIDYRFYVWYHGGWTLAQHYNDFINNNPAGIFSIANDNHKWLNLENSVTMSQVLSQYEFDVLCLQEYMNTQTTISTEACSNVISYIREHYNKAFKVVTLLHPPKRSDIDAVYERTVNEVKAIISDTEAEMVIDTGSSVMEAMNTSLDELGDQGHLSPDGTHTQEGLPCLVQTYVHALWLFRLLGLPYGVANSKLRITQEVYDSINVPGPNLGTGVITGTDAQHAIAQLCAIRADKDAKRLEIGMSE